MTLNFHHSPRLYIDMPLVLDGNILLDTHHAHYLGKVMRLSAGDIVRVFNSKDGEFLAKISVVKTSVSLIIMTCLKQPDVSMLDLSLAQCMIKPDRFSTLLSMATQLGVQDIYPIISARTQIHDLNVGRFAKIIIEASEQSERCSIPIMHDRQSLKQFVLAMNGHIFWGHERGQLSYKLSDIESSKVCILVGPEGGFTPDEVEFLLSQAHCTAVNLGARILRAETAAVALLSIVNYQYSYF